MKLLIELDEEYVNAIDKIKFLVGGRTNRKLQLEIIKAIKNGKPLEQEPTTKNDNEQEDITWIIGNDNVQIAVRNMPIDMMQKICSIIGNTKNDLGVENDLVSSIVEKISEKVTETREEFIFETIRPYCENVVQMKISKRDLEQALLKYYGKNDLAVDCISRADAIKAMQDKAKKLKNEDTINGLCGAVAILFDMPSVTPQPCEDAVSRQAVLELIADYDLSMGQVVRGIHALPSVTPIRLKGHWIDTNDKGFEYHRLYKCSNCECTVCAYPEEIKSYKFCYGCGSRNEVEE